MMRKLLQRSNKGRRTISSSVQTLTELGSQPDGLRGNLRASGTRTAVCEATGVREVR